MKKVFASLLSILLFLALVPLAACGDKTTPPTPEQQFQTAWETYEVAWAEYAAAVEAYVAKFNAEVPTEFAFSKLDKADYLPTLNITAVQVAITTLTFSATELTQRVQEFVGDAV